MFDILHSVTFIPTFASRAKSIAHVHDVHESLMFLPDCLLFAVFLAVKIERKPSLVSKKMK